MHSNIIRFISVVIRRTRPFLKVVNGIRIDDLLTFPDNSATKFILQPIHNLVMDKGIVINM